MKECDSKTSLSLTHQSLEGKANLVVFRKDEETLLYAGNEDNRMYVFNLEGVQCASTSLHSHDDYLFQAIFPTATDIQSIPLYSCYELSGSKGEAISNADETKGQSSVPRYHSCIIMLNSLISVD